MISENMKWDNAYSLGIKNIDEQHKQLFEIVSKIFSLQESRDVKENIRTILHELHDYIKVHFKDEEEFMKNIGYPDLEYHHLLHIQLAKSVSNILQDPSRLDIIQTKMRVIAKRALIDHILEEDSKFQQYYFKMKKNQTMSDETIITLDV